MGIIDHQNLLERFSWFKFLRFSRSKIKHQDRANVKSKKTVKLDSFLIYFNVDEMLNQYLLFIVLYSTLTMY